LWSELKKKKKKKKSFRKMMVVASGSGLGQRGGDGFLGVVGLLKGKTGKCFFFLIIHKIGRFHIYFI
jgi:hypothetical protein